MFGDSLDPSRIDTRLDSRAVSFENPTGARGAGGQTQGGRKGAPSRRVEPGETVQLADLEGPGTIRHVWMTFPPARPERMRALSLEVRYDGESRPSISVPALDFFGLPHGRPAAYSSALMSAQEGRGFNSYLPLPFRRRIQIALTNHSERPTLLYYQLDYTLEPELAPETGLLHVSFRRENPTVLKRDFAIAEGLRGPGRYLGCNVGIRTLPQPHFGWYGEGELKIYRDGDGAWPTICGTGLEDYVGTAWGMGSHFAPYGGVPLDLRGPDAGPIPDFVSFYRWHLLDPVVFQRELRVTIQQIGYAALPLALSDDELAAVERANPAAGTGWQRDNPRVRAHGIAERVDDYCACAYVYCRDAQPVPQVDMKAATADIARRPYESPQALELLMGTVSPSA
ncbi:MAG TPA: glycoside hydrolase family 172 protein [Myxococcota bacterium]|nr:glycoside hydrolase family 172 protein [Myxococcota bacterium]